MSASAHDEDEYGTKRCNPVTNPGAYKTMVHDVNDEQYLSIYDANRDQPDGAWVASTLTVQVKP